jgi:hypothetical protein
MRLIFQFSPSSFCFRASCGCQLASGAVHLSLASDAREGGEQGHGGDRRAEHRSSPCCCERDGRMMMGAADLILTRQRAATSA